MTCLLTDYFLGIIYFYKSALLSIYIQTHKYMYFTDIGSPLVSISVSNHIERYTLDCSLQHHKLLAVIFHFPLQVFRLFPIFCYSNYAKSKDHFLHLFLVMTIYTGKFLLLPQRHLQYNYHFQLANVMSQACNMSKCFNLYFPFTHFLWLLYEIITDFISVLFPFYR